MTSPQPLKRASVALLRQIAEHDQGDGVLFQPAPRGCRRLDGTEYSTREETFRVPSQLGHIAVDHPRLGVWRVQLTDSGREYLAQADDRRAKHGPFKGATANLVIVDEAVNW
ncbi:hypothetical protein SAMN05421874_12865 [Nonomuraea maritima]|uniref:Uncharacterized protein n=1 Tax=Nonomuraea maritima TaxID=683260 RepID=A0A1G9MKE7_9ACTN|nr:hypothetical protein [Nonomuraea maritima]SDL74387.1 hypothetical protein SAMN05421874_12865 [Nonomuraea maritima]